MSCRHRRLPLLLIHVASTGWSWCLNQACCPGFECACPCASSGALVPCLLALTCPPNLPPLQEAPTPALPLYTEEWVEELLSRCFAIITNLDSPEHRGGCCTLCMLWLPAWVLSGGFCWRRQPCLPACKRPPAALPVPSKLLGAYPCCAVRLCLCALLLCWPAAGEHGGQGQKLAMEEGSFLLDSNSMFRYCRRYGGRYCAQYSGLYCFCGVGT